MFSFLGRHQDSGEVAAGGKGGGAKEGSSPRSIYSYEETRTSLICRLLAVRNSPLPLRLSTCPRINFTLQRNDSNTNPFKDLED